MSRSLAIKIISIISVLKQKLAKTFYQSTKSSRNGLLKVLKHLLK